jgi:nucleoside-diphosphate-sugar epimerase
MSKPGKSVFLIGPGYIGLEVLDRLLENGYDVTALVRREEAAQDLKKRGAKSVMGTIADKDIITKQSALSDIVIHTATADDMPSVEAVIDGIDQRAKQDKFTIYIHTSGCSFLSDDSEGAYKSDQIYSDKKPADMDARPDSSSHREIDLAIIKARNRLGQKAKLFIMLPPLIYGATKNDRLSIQVITLARFALKHKYAGHVGKGKAEWGTIHVSDLSHGYLTMLKWLESSPPEAALEHPYFFCENGEEISWGDIAAFIGEELKAAGRLDDASPREIPKEQWDDLFGMYSSVVVGANARNRADRLRDLDWKPTHRDMREAFKKEELPTLLSETGEFNGYGRAAASGSG